MNSRAPAITRALPVSELRAERREPGGTQLVRDLLRADAPPGAAVGTGRTLAIALAALLNAETTGTNASTPARTAESPADSGLRARATLAAQRGLALPAVVLDTLPGGSVRLSIGAAEVLIDLPEAQSAGLARGETIFLRPHGGTAAAAALDAPVAPAAQSVAAAPAAELGTTALLVSRLVSRMPGGEGPAPIATPSPLAAEAGNAAQIAAGLKQALTGSGLFYESHLADWVNGSGDTADLLREPQAGFAAPGASTVATATAGAGAAGPQTATAGPLLPQAEAMIQRQLDVLEHRCAQWQGQAWPGQDAQVRIDEEDRRGDEAPPTGRTWQATLRLSMAGLGALEALVGLAGKDATLAIRAADPQGARRLRVGQAEFARALAERGLRLTHARIDDAGRP